MGRWCSPPRAKRSWRASSRGAATGKPVRSGGPEDGSERKRRPLGNPVITNRCQQARAAQVIEPGPSPPTRSRRTSTRARRCPAAPATCTRGPRARPAGPGGRGPEAETSTGEIGLIVPTHDITETGQTHTVDGVEIEFQMAPGPEAPAEMHFYLPRFRASLSAAWAHTPGQGRGDTPPGPRDLAWFREQFYLSLTWTVPFG
jgi:hypothetical protein